MAIRRKWLYAALAWLALVIASVTAMTLYDDAPERLRSMLKIEELPASVKNIRCSDTFVTTDVLATCGFEIEPDDMVSMLGGWRFSGEKAGPNTRSDDYANDDHTYFTPFKADYIYRADDDQFGTAGGHLLVVIDEDRRNALVDIYIE
ncbi:hypothetical protein QTL95_19930 [Rhizobium sp. S152]|uniref:hypothetical protein n=1 Tax=Rhizobium sp. S152 TaxID=3055038 RepID=UPI0025A9A7E6|nr:hypothetical protein [Rhizobium sp. S152]MDM9628165.1 hypothetical protein [Rhizobium sp. S152]